MASQIARNRRLTSCTHILGPIVLVMLASLCQSASLDLFVTRRTIHRWARTGVDPWRADRAAIAVGFHPVEVWGRDWRRLP